MATFTIPNSKSIATKEDGTFNREWFIYLGNLLDTLGSGVIGTATQVLHGNGSGFSQINLGSDVTQVLPGVNGGTGVSNALKSITLGGDLTISGTSSLILSVTASSSVVVPTAGTLLVQANIGTIAIQNSNSVNITGGTISTVTVLGSILNTVTVAATTLTTVSTASFGGAIQPATPASAAQTACQLWAGTGVPSNANGQNGDYYFRSDGGVTTHLYFKAAGAWAGLI